MKFRALNFDYHMEAVHRCRGEEEAEATPGSSRENDGAVIQLAGFIPRPRKPEPATEPAAAPSDSSTSRDGEPCQTSITIDEVVEQAPITANTTSCPSDSKVSFEEPTDSIDQDATAPEKTRADDGHTAKTTCGTLVVSSIAFDPRFSSSTALEYVVRCYLRFIRNQAYRMRLIEKDSLPSGHEGAVAPIPPLANVVAALAALLPWMMNQMQTVATAKPDACSLTLAEVPVVGSGQEYSRGCSISSASHQMMESSEREHSCIQSTSGSQCSVDRGSTKREGSPLTSASDIETWSTPKKFRLGHAAGLDSTAANDVGEMPDDRSGVEGVGADYVDEVMVVSENPHFDVMDDQTDSGYVFDENPIDNPQIGCGDDAKDSDDNTEVVQNHKNKKALKRLRRGVKKARKREKKRKRRESLEAQNVVPAESVEDNANEHGLRTQPTDDMDRFDIGCEVQADAADSYVDLDKSNPVESEPTTSGSLASKAYVRKNAAVELERARQTLLRTTRGSSHLRISRVFPSRDKKPDLKPSALSIALNPGTYHPAPACPGESRGQPFVQSREVTQKAQTHEKPSSTIMPASSQNPGPWTRTDSKTALPTKSIPRNGGATWNPHMPASSEQAVDEFPTFSESRRIFLQPDVNGDSDLTKGFSDPTPENDHIQNCEPEFTEEIDYHTLPPVSVLCSERFLQVWADVCADLATGRWVYSMLGEHTRDSDLNTMLGRKVNLVGCEMVALKGVDIELPGRTSILLFTTSALDNDDEARDSTVALAALASLGRYSLIVVILCYDEPTTSSIMNHILEMQSAVCTEFNPHGSKALFKHAMMNAVPEVVAETVFSAERQFQPRVPPLTASLVSNPLYRERAYFLSKMVPILSATGSYQCLRLAEQMAPEGSSSFRLLFVSERFRKAVADAIVSDEQVSREIHPVALWQLNEALKNSM
jgi:hypothetical protein